jgi:anti-sigma B factor antagonist
MEGDLEIGKRKKGDVVILDLQGNLTIGVNEASFKEMVSDLLSRGYNKIIVNLQNVDIIDSSGVGALVKSYTTITQSGGKLKLLQPNKIVKHTLKITGLLGIFETHEEEGAAISSF